MWHVSSHSGVATLRTAIHLLLTYLLTYITAIEEIPHNDTQSLEPSAVDCKHGYLRVGLVAVYSDYTGLLGHS